MDSDPAAQLPSKTLRIAVGLALLIISGYGVIITVYVLQALSRNPKFRASFYHLCRSRTISDFLICFIFFIWAAPSTLLGYTYLPFIFNVSFGQLSNWVAYIAGVLVQSVMAVNRFVVSYWPLRTSSSKYAVTISLTICWLIAIGYTVFIAKDCALIFSVELITWVTVDGSCSAVNADYFLLAIIVLTLCTNSLNIATFVKLIYQIKKSSQQVSTSHSDQRQRKNQLMFAQSFTQDILYVIDVINSAYFSTLSSEIWFQILCLSVNFLVIHVLDATTMLIFNKGIYPKFCGNSKNLKSRTIAITKVSKLQSTIIN